MASLGYMRACLQNTHTPLAALKKNFTYVSACFKKGDKCKFGGCSVKAQFLDNKKLWVLSSALFAWFSLGFGVRGVFKQPLVHLKTTSWWNAA